MSEKAISHKILMALTEKGSRLFRNTVGLAWQGKAERIGATKTVVVHKGDVVIRGARAVTVGLGTHTSDLIGWTCTEIRPHNVGGIFSQFTAVEVKDEDGVATPEQLQFLKVVKESGGIAILARSAEQAVKRLYEGGNIE